jgi:hypothetical protein
LTKKDIKRERGAEKRTVVRSVKRGKLTVRHSSLIQPRLFNAGGAKREIWGWSWTEVCGRELERPIKGLWSVTQKWYFASR